jgi:type IV pilus assembly protein PilM
MIRRTYLGLDIRCGELRAVALHRHGRSARLTNGRLLSLADEILQPALRRANILDRRRFVSALEEVLHPLAGNEERIAVSLPEGAGRLLLSEVDQAFASREEGAEILRWQLKNQLPDDARDVHLDFQTLGMGQNGRIRLLVGLISRSVLNDYEEIIAEAGYGAQLIDFHPLNIYNFYRQRLEMGSDFVLVGVDRQTLSLQVYQERILGFFRACDIKSDPALVFQELSRSLAGQKENFPGIGRSPVFVHCDWPETGEILAAVNTVFGHGATLLEADVQQLATVPLDLPVWRLRGLAAAIGAAERLL